jgi:predicted dehydrogenase
MTDLLKVGIVGAGGMGNMHARCWSRLPGARVTAVADPQTNKARDLAGRVGQEDAPTVLASADEMLAHADVDVVSVCVPTSLHRTVPRPHCEPANTFCAKSRWRFRSPTATR